MDGIIKVKNEGYAEYEEVLLERDHVRKEALLWKMAYTKEFGKLVTDLFEIKISCIKKKKMISYCQAEVNKGKVIDRDAVFVQINKEMQEYNRQLERMIAENEAANSGHQISSDVVTKIKKIYRRMAKMLHPDINPKTDEVPALKKLWHMIVASYRANDLEELEAAEVLVKKAFEDAGLENIVIEINDIAEKIKKIQAEITAIKSKDPYQYKFLLQDDEAVKEKREALQKEISEYADYEKELDIVMEQFLSSGVRFKWTTD